MKEGEAHGGDRAAALAWAAAEARWRSAGPAAAMLTACGHAKAWIKSCAPGKGEATHARLVHPDPPPASLAVAFLPPVIVIACLVSYLLLWYIFQDIPELLVILRLSTPLLETSTAHPRINFCITPR